MARPRMNGDYEIRILGTQNSDTGSLGCLTAHQETMLTKNDYAERIKKLTTGSQQGPLFTWDHVLPHELRTGRTVLDEDGKTFLSTSKIRPICPMAPHNMCQKKIDSAGFLHLSIPVSEYFPNSEVT